MNQMEKFIREVNKAFSENDIEYLVRHVSEDFCWIIVGRNTLSGKAQFAEALEQIRDMPPMKIDVRSIIINDRDVIVEGIVVGRNRNDQKKSFGFCDIYRLAGPKERMIQRMTSYVIDISKHKQYKESC